MNNIEKQLNTIMRCLVADTEEGRSAARKELLEMVISNNAAAGAADLDSTIRAVLLDIGVPTHLIGYPYLITAIKAIAETPEMLRNITGELYPFVASQHETTSSRAERAIRHAIECAWDRGDMDTMRRYFGNTVSKYKGKTTNGEFISRVADVVRMRLNGA